MCRIFFAQWNSAAWKVTLNCGDIIFTARRNACKCDRSSLILSVRSLPVLWMTWMMIIERPLKYIIRSSSLFTRVIISHLETSSDARQRPGNMRSFMASGRETGSCLFHLSSCVNARFTMHVMWRCVRSVSNGNAEPAKQQKQHSTAKYAKL